jgi:DNA-directed RNA polymerase specialized sigma24 family protein
MPENPVHRAVVDRYIFEDLSAEETAEVINDTFDDELKRPMTTDNVHQIASRFRETLRRLLGEHET